MLVALFTGPVQEDVSTGDQWAAEFGSQDQPDKQPVQPVQETVATMVCSMCAVRLPRDKFSASQKKKKHKACCKACVATKAGAGHDVSSEQGKQEQQSSAKTAPDSKWEMKQGPGDDGVEEQEGCSIQ